jgi:uncharacterized membrane protein YtjA (UPF0391 family)
LRWARPQQPSFAAGIAKIIFIVALVMAIVSFLAGRRPPA